MRNALQEQLLKAGLIKDKEIKEAHKQQRREDRRPPPVKGAPPPPPAARTEADRARAAKAERDRGLNAEREARAARKALISQIAQLIDPFRRPHNDGEEVYNFIDGGAVKRIYVAANTRAALACRMESCVCAACETAPGVSCQRRCGARRQVPLPVQGASTSTPS